MIDDFRIETEPAPPGPRGRFWILDDLQINQAVMLYNVTIAAATRAAYRRKTKGYKYTCRTIKQDGRTTGVKVWRIA